MEPLGKPILSGQLLSNYYCSCELSEDHIEWQRINQLADVGRVERGGFEFLGDLLSALHHSDTLLE